MKTKKQQQNKIATIKTFCCNSTYTKIGRAKWICDKCGKDVSMQIIIYHQSLYEKNDQ